MTAKERKKAIDALKISAPVMAVTQEEFENYIKTLNQVMDWLEQEPIITSTEDNAEMIYPQVDGITPTVIEPIGDDYKYIKSISNPTGIEFDIDIPKKIESYEKLLKYPVVKHIMDMDETQEQLDFIRPHKQIPVTLAVSGYDKLIDLANAIENDDSDYWTNKKISSALRNISSIEPQSCEDTISRQAAIDANCYNCSIKANGGKCSKCDAVKVIEKLPSVKPQEKTGHWIDTGSGQECSECHEIQYGYDNHRFYCGNCGAKMEVEQNG